MNPARSASAGEENRRRPIQHTVRVRDLQQSHSAGVARPMRLVPALSAASQRRIQQLDAENRRQGGNPRRTSNTTTSANGKNEVQAEDDDFLNEPVDDDVESTHHSIPRSVASSAGVRSYVSTASTAMSTKSLVLLERELRKQLPLTSDGAKVILTAADVGKIRDPQTLQFLHEFAQLFVQQGRSESTELLANQGGASPSALSGEAKTPTPKKRPDGFKGVDASELASVMEDLGREISTFITATDINGVEYNIATDPESGELHVPLALAEENEQMLGKGNGAKGIEGEEDDIDEALADLDRDLEELLGGLAAQGDASAGDGTSDLELGESVDGGEDSVRSLHPDEDPEPEAEFQRKLEAVLSSEDEMKMLLQNPVDSDLDAISSESNNSKNQAPVPSPPRQEPPTKTGGFKSSWCNRKPIPSSSASVGGGSDSGLSQPRSNRGSFLSSRLPGAPSASSKAGSSSSAVAGPTKALQKSAYYKLDAEEEARVNWILDHDDWETKAMDRSETAEMHGDGSQSTTSSRASTTTSKLGYDRASAGSYAAVEAYGMDKATQKRLSEIDQKLNKLVSLRSKMQRNGGVQLSAGIAALLLEDAPQATTTAESGTGSAGSTPTKSKTRAEKSQSGTGANTGGSPTKSGAIKPTPGDTIAQKAAKEKANALLREMQAERRVRQKLGALNDRLSEISSELEILSSPPFCFQLQYHAAAEPKEVQWPPEVQAPSESEVQALLQQCKEEQALYLEAMSDDA